MSMEERIRFYSKRFQEIPREAAGMLESGML